MINWIDEVGAPVTVTAINLGSRTMFPEYHDWVIYGLTGLGYLNLAGVLGRSNEFMKNSTMGLAPLAAEKIYNRIRTGFPAPTRAARYSRASRYPAPAFDEEFRGVRLD